MTVQRILTILCLIWAIGAAVLAFQTAPSIPLDVSAGDPATLEAFNAARQRHGLTWAGIALAPLLLVTVLGRLFGR